MEESFETLQRRDEMEIVRWTTTASLRVAGVDVIPPRCFVDVVRRRGAAAGPPRGVEVVAARRVAVFLAVEACAAAARFAPEADPKHDPKGHVRAQDLSGAGVVVEPAGPGAWRVAVVAHTAVNGYLPARLVRAGDTEGATRVPPCVCLVHLGARADGARIVDLLFTGR